MSEKSTDLETKLKKYGESEKGNFRVIDTIGVPHPYCITPKHLEYCDSIYLSPETIRRAEKKGAVCDICKKSGKRPILSYDEHEQGLLVECDVEIEANKEELHKYLLKIKDMTIKDGFVGFAFVKSKKLEAMAK